jgi:threonine/homoserine efflux transporter RhtA
VPPSAPSLGGREILSRTMYGGFWAVVAVVVGCVALTRLSDGEFGAFLLGIVVAAAAGFYARYIFRGGRFRFLVF